MISIVILSEMGMPLILLMLMKISVVVNAYSAHGSAEAMPPKMHSPTSIAVAPSFSSLHQYASFHKHRRRNKFSYSAPTPSYLRHRTNGHRGPSVFPHQSPSPSPVAWGSPASAPSPTRLSSQFSMPTLAPTISPLGYSLKKLRTPPPPPIMALPPVPPNKDCMYMSCTEPLTYNPPGSPCGCVWPLQVKLCLDVSLYTFFPLVSELASEIAAAVSLNHSQVRIIRADAASQQLEKTNVLVDLVPRGVRFNETTAFDTYKKFWHKQVLIKTSLFGTYDVLYVHYPGLPPSPPSSISNIDGHPYAGSNDNGNTIKPIAVEVLRKTKQGLSTGIIAVIVLSSFAALLICLGIASIFLWRSGACVSKTEKLPLALIAPPRKASENSRSKPGSTSRSFSSSALAYTGSAKTFALNDIERATNSFDGSRIVGEGGFGIVYRGILDDGREVAVKVLKRDDRHGGREFLAEVEMLGRLHHRNLVKLIGICTEGNSRSLVYELVPNGSVESHLHGVDKATGPLDWDARIKIALGAARGLAYLHEDSSPRVIHRDFKSSNILLEHDFTPKVSDFGLARAALEEANKHISTHVMGTFGYLAPEYAMTGHLLVKSDVYSYGVVLLELLTGRKPVDLSQPPGQENLVSWARPLLTNKESLETTIDPTIKAGVSSDSVAKVAAIASMCVQPEVSHRPFMGEVVQALKLVFNELDERKELGSRSISHEDFSIVVDSKITKVSGEPGEVSHTCHPIPINGSPGTKIALPVSDTGTTIGFKGQEYESFKRRSSSGPLGTGRKFWQRLRSLSRKE